VLVLTTDNASANDKLVQKLDKLENTFEADNHVRCFNHTLQLSAKALIWPFNPGMAKDKDADHLNDDTGVMLEVDDDDDDGDTNSDEELTDDRDDGIDEMEALSESEREALLENTAEIREAVSKVRLSPKFVPPF
jgi:hypothetical protein